MTRDYDYSYELYAPGDPGPRIDYEDHFVSRRGAVSAMKEAMLAADVPIGSTAFVCRRYDDGDITDAVDYIKNACIRRLP